jgi:indoleamine 2,3-dioxygenase
MMIVMRVAWLPGRQLIVLLACTGIAPLLTNASVVLWNWRRFNTDDSVNLSNLACLRTTVAGLDESWFYLVTVEIEAKGAAV